MNIKGTDAMNTQVEELFKSKLTVINVGPSVFGEAARSQGVQVLQVDWKPSMADDQEMNDILKILGGI